MNPREAGVAMLISDKADLMSGVGGLFISIGLKKKYHENHI